MTKDEKRQLKEKVLHGLHNAREVYKFREISEFTDIPSVALSIFLSKETLGEERLQKLDTWLDTSGFYGEVLPERIEPTDTSEEGSFNESVNAGLNEEDGGITDFLPDPVSSDDLQVDPVSDQEHEAIREAARRIFYEEALVDLRNKERAVLEALREAYKDQSHLLGYPREEMEEVLRAEEALSRL